MLPNFTQHTATKKIVLVFISLLFAVKFLAAQNVGIGTNNPNASALLDVTATNKGVLIPRVTNPQMVAIATPAEGLLIYNTDSAAFAYRSGTAWIFLKGNTNGSNNWNTKGNPGTNAVINFIGTTDNVDVIFRRNNLKAGLLNTSNTSWGVEALNSNAAGNYNTANGYQALNKNTGGSSNTAIGLQSLFSNTSGGTNTAVGAAALALNNTGYSNVAIGVAALQKNTNRSNLVAIGDSALFNNGAGAFQSTHASANTAIGSKTLFSNTTGSYNTANGYQSLYTNDAGSSNTALGSYALTKNISGDNNTAVGSNSLYTNKSGSANTALGNAALYTVSTGSNNIGIGQSALALNDIGENNTVIGSYAGYNNTGRGNIFIGSYAGYNESGSDKLYVSNDITDAANTLIYGEFDNKILSIGGRLGIGTSAPETLLHLKNANTDANASQLIIEGNSNYGAATYAAIDLRSHNASYGIATTGRIKSYNDGANFTDSKIVLQTIAAGPSFVDAMVLSNGNVSIPNGNLFAGGHAGIGISPDPAYPLAIKGRAANEELLIIYNSSGVAKWHMSLVGSGGSLNFVETGVADYRLLLGVGGEVGIGKVPLITSNDSRLQIKQKGTQNGIGVEAANSINHWDFYTTTAAASNFALYYNGSLKGTFDNVTGAYTANSDRRLKKDITTQLPVLNKVMELQAYQYHYLDNQSTDRFSNGFMAQDVQKIFPDAVVENEMKDGEKRLGINYQYFTVLAIKGLQEQQKDIEQMKAQMKLMMEEIEKLKKK